MLNPKEVGSFLRSLPVVARLFERRDNSAQTEGGVHGGGKMETDDYGIISKELSKRR